MNEGVIKFRIEKWNKTPPLNETDYLEIEMYRKKLHDLKLIGVDKNTNLGYGNISKLIDNNRFIISSTQTGHLEILDGKNYCIVESTNFENNSLICSGYSEPSSEAMTHSAFYKSNDKINCVIHIHNNKLWEKLINENILSTPENIEYGSKELYQSITNLLKDKKYNEPFVVVIKGHKDGIFIAGNGLHETFSIILKLIK